MSLWSLRHWRRGFWVLVCASLLSPTLGRAENLYTPNNFSAMVADRRAEKVGDSLTVIINENSTASNTSKAGSSRATTLAGQLMAGASTNGSFQLNANSAFDGNGQTGRSGKMVAQISVVVDQLLPNGDLHVSGDQWLNINGNHTKIRLSGRVRLADISSTNSVLSTNLANAVIDYDGKGFLSDSVKPGVVTRIFNWLGLF